MNKSIGKWLKNSTNEKIISISNDTFSFGCILQLSSFYLDYSLFMLLCSVINNYSINSFFFSDNEKEIEWNGKVWYFQMENESEFSLTIWLFTSYLSALASL